MKRSPRNRGEKRPRAALSARSGFSLVEMVHEPESLETALLARRAGSIERCREVELDGELLVPYSPRNNLLTHRVLRLPSGVAEYVSTAELAGLVQDFIHRYVDVSEGFEIFATWYVLFTWVHDDYAALPYLRVRGDFGCGKSRFLEVVGSLAYKPIFASGASSISPLFRIMDAACGTLVLDESDFRLSDEKAEVVKILNNGNARGFPVLRSEQTPGGEYNPRAFRVFGPKIIASRRSFEDVALESRCITEDMRSRSVRGDIPLSLPSSFDEEALRIRNKLLGFRFAEAGRPRASVLDGQGSLEPRVRQLCEPVAQLTSDARVHDAIVLLGEAQSRAIADERSWSTPEQVRSVILSMIEADVHPISLGEIARAFKREYGSGSRMRVTPRWIGSILRRDLGLRPVKRGGTYVLGQEDYARLATPRSRYT